MSLSLSGNLQSQLRPGWVSRAVTFLLWALAGWSAVFWGLRLGASGNDPAVAAPAVRLPEPADPLAVGRLLGATAVAADTSPASDRLLLTGVVAGPAGSGTALIAVEGLPPRPYRVGAQVQDDLWLQSVQPRRVQLGPTRQGPATLTLELPASPTLDLGQGS